jgi:hypothetical protein
MTTTHHRGLKIITGSARLPGDLKTTPRPAGEPSGLSPEVLNLSASRDSNPRPGASWTMRIFDWIPTPLNELMGRHWGVAARLKADDAAEIRIAMVNQHIPVAQTKLRLSVLIVLPKGKRAVDPDSIQKSLCDALVQAGALKNDSHLWVEHQPVQFARGQRLTTYVTLEML